VVEPHEQLTGHPGVDRVLRSLEELSDRPVSEHVAAFETAHAGLRDALSDAAETRTAPAVPSAPGPGPA
jgi:hypothetical protein